MMSPKLCHGCDCAGDPSNNLVVQLMEFQHLGAVSGNILITSTDAVLRNIPGLQHHLKHLQN